MYIVEVYCSFHCGKLFIQQNNLGRYTSFIAVVMNSKDWYEIIGLCKISHFIKQFCKNVCLEKY